MINELENDLINLVKATKKEVERLDENNPNPERLAKLIGGLKHSKKYTGYLTFWNDLEAESKKISILNDPNEKAHYIEARVATLEILNTFLETHFN